MHLKDYMSSWNMTTNFELITTKISKHKGLLTYHWLNIQSNKVEIHIMFFCMFVVVVFVKHNLFVKKIMKIAYRSKGYNFISKMLSTSSELEKKWL